MLFGNHDVRVCLFFFNLFIFPFCTDNWQELVKRIKSKGMTPGVALKPGTPIEEVFPLVCLPALLRFFFSLFLYDSQVCSASVQIFID